MKYYYYFYRIPDVFDIEGLKGKPNKHFLKRYSKAKVGPKGKKIKIGFGPDALTDSKPLARGGKVALEVIDDQEHVLIRTEAHCSFQDNFCYSLGKKIALGRAMKELNA